jgi:hypothetical protein
VLLHSLKSHIYSTLKVIVIVWSENQIKAYWYSFQIPVYSFLVCWIHYLFSYSVRNFDIRWLVDCVQWICKDVEGNACGLIEVSIPGVRKTIKVFSGLSKLHLIFKPDTSRIQVTSNSTYTRLLSLSYKILVILVSTWNAKFVMLMIYEVN